MDKKAKGQETLSRVAVSCADALPYAVVRVQVASIWRPDVNIVNRMNIPRLS